MSDDALKPATPLTSYVININAWHVPPNKRDLGLNPVDYAVRDHLQQMAYQHWRFMTINQLKKAIVAEGEKCFSIWLIAPLVSGVASWMRRPAARRRHFDVKTVRCDFLNNNWDNKHVVSVINFLKCVATKVVLFLIVIFKTADISQGGVVTHFSCSEIYSNSFIANCLLILTVKEFWKSVNI